MIELRPSSYPIIIPPQSVTRQMLEDNFPMSGRFHFRIKVMRRNRVMWMDLGHPNDIARPCEGIICVKVRGFKFRPACEFSVVSVHRHGCEFS